MTASPASILRPVAAGLRLVRVRCALCGGSGAPVLEKNGMIVERCSGCGFLFVNPRPTPRALAGLYNDRRGEVARAVHGFEDADPPDRREERHREALYRLARLRQFRAGGSLVDIGCGRGETLALAASAFDAVGVDVSRDAAREAAKVAPGRLVQGSLEKLPFRDGSVDLALLTEVLEHAFDPMAALREARRVLRSRGILGVQTGDADSLLPRLNFAEWTYVQPPVHLNFFTRPTLMRALRSAGFRVLASSSFGRAPWMALDAVPLIPRRLRAKGEGLRPLLDAAASVGLVSQLVIAERM